MIDFVSKLQPDGSSDLATACKRFALTNRRKGVCVVLSDFFDKSGYERVHIAHHSFAGSLPR